jgi:hypothetical protein
VRRLLISNNAAEQTIFHPASDLSELFKEEGLNSRLQTCNSVSFLTHIAQ